MRRQPASSPLDVPDSLQVGIETAYYMRWPQWFEVMVQTSPTGCLRHELWHKLALEGTSSVLPDSNLVVLNSRNAHVTS